MQLALNRDINSPQDFLNELRALILHSDEFKGLPRKQRAIYIAIRGELTECLQEATEDLLEQCLIYLRIIEYCCDLEDWQRAKLLILSYIDKNRTVSEQLDILGFYSDKYKIYANLIGKLDLNFDCFLWGEIGSAHAKLDNIENAIKCYDNQLEISQNINDYDNQVNVYNELSRLYSFSKLYNLKKSLEYAQKSLQGIKEFNIQDYKKHVYALTNLAAAFNDFKKYKDAISNIEKALFISEQNEDSYLVSYCLTELGGIYGEMQNLEKAVDILSLQANILKKLKYRRLEAVCLHNLGGYQCIRDSSNSYYKNEGSFQKAIEHLLDSIEICREIKTKALEYLCYITIGTIYLRRKEYKTSLEYFQKITLGYLGGRNDAILLSNISAVHGCQKNFALAIKYAQKAITLSRETQSKKEEAFAIAVIGNAYWYQRRYFIGIAYVIKSFFFIPPWKSLDSMLILNILSTEISDLLKLKQSQFVDLLKKIFRIRD